MAGKQREEEGMILEGNGGRKPEWNGRQEATKGESNEGSKEGRSN